MSTRSCRAARSHLHVTYQHAHSTVYDCGHSLQRQTRYQKMWVRTKSTVAMIGGFIFCIYMGHVPLMFLIFAIQVGSSYYASCLPALHCLPHHTLPICRRVCSSAACPGGNRHLSAEEACASANRQQ